MSNTWNDFLAFINDHPLGVAAKVFAATALTYVVDNIAGFGLPTVLVVAIPPAVVVLIDWLNDQNYRFGRKDEDV